MNKLPIAFFGTNGHQISTLVARLERARLVGVAGVSHEALAAWRREMPDAYAHAQLFLSLGDLLERSGARLVSICSPRRDRQHLDVVAALDAGLHVYAEKPLATTLAGLDAIEAAAARTGNQVRSMTGTVYDPVFGEIRGLIQAGKLGEVVQVFAQKSYPYHDRRPQDNGIDGGLIQQASVHAVGYVRYVTGAEFEEVFAMSTRTGNPTEGDLQMAAQLVARLTGGALCTLVANYCNPPGIGFWGNDQLRVHGTAGMVEVVDAGHRTLVALGSQPPVPLASPAITTGYPDLLEDYVAHLLDGSPMLLSQHDSFANTRVVIRAQESADSGRPVPV